MKKAIILAALIFFVLLIQGVFASYYQIEMYQYGDKVLEKHNISLDFEQDD